MKILDVPQSGSVAGDTSSRNRFGQYRRTRAIPVNPNTPRQIAVRALFTTASQYWQGLADSSRAAWHAYAAGNPKVDSLGQTIYLTGFQQFVAYWTAVSGAGLTPLTTPPPVPPLAPPPITSLAAIENVSVTLVLAEAATATEPVVVEAIGNISPGISFFTGFRRLGVFTSGTSLALITPFTAVFGAPVIDKQIVVRCYRVAQDAGRGGVTQATCLVDVAP